MNLSFTTIMTEVQRSFKRVREEEEDRASKLPRAELDVYTQSEKDRLYSACIDDFARLMFGDIRTNKSFRKLVRSLNKMTRKMSKEDVFLYVTYICDNVIERVDSILIDQIIDFTSESCTNFGHFDRPCVKTTEMMTFEQHMTSKQIELADEIEEQISELASQVELELDVLEEMRDSIDFDHPDNQVKVLSDLRHRFVEDFLVNIRRVVDVNCNLLNATSLRFHMHRYALAVY